MEKVGEKGFHYIGMGLVTENKPLSTKTILVNPLELLPGQQGDQSSQLKRVAVSGKDFKSTFYTNNSREAEWLPSDSRFITAPDVRRGEKVRLYQYGDSNKWYWKEMGDGRSKRRGETVILGASGYFKLNDSGLPEEKDIIENYYRVEMSGHRKCINIVTANKNGEKSIYKLLLDGARGVIALGDALGNEIYLNTDNKLINIKNSEGTFVCLDKKNLLLFAQEKMLLQSNYIGIKAKDLVVTTTNTTLTATNITTSGAWKHTGNMDVKGKITGSDGISSPKEIKTDSDLLIGNKSMGKHYHRCPDGTTGGPL